MSPRVILRSKVKDVAVWSRSESESEMGDKLRGMDPKLSELPMARMKLQ